MDPLFAFVIANTVGPSTSAIYSMYLGAQYGVRGAIQFATGTSCGFTVVLVATAFVQSAEVRLPVVLLVSLKFLATAYMLWLAWRFLWAAFFRMHTQAGTVHLGLGSGIGQQLANPKGWLLAAVTLTTFSDSEASAIGEGLRISLLYASCGVPVALAWAALGSRKLAWFDGLKVPLALLCAALLTYSATKIWSSG